MMHRREKSDLAIVATKPANKADRSVAEPVERRAGAKGSAGQQGASPAQNRASVSQALVRIRQAVGSWPEVRFAVTHPRWEPYALIGPVRICAGGARPYRDRIMRVAKPAQNARAFPTSTNARPSLNLRPILREKAQNHRLTFC
jgi:hypothetical protein